ncbi:MAG: bifunctional phosphopantothenoylcysteine decarboxylase/phosphopantothenate--cysteine ligase CoaBC [Clostridiales bacterium]|nr:bifunctional phosphopantothenoylcysteine decarboxylase/phosphopantothenate--cysteine ligase CoaBC [Clostridiales bacterium]
MLTGKRIVLGVTGGIAAYKTVELCRLFVKSGAQVRVIMTEASKRFVTPLTFQTVSGHAVYDDLFSAATRYSVEHIGLAKEADLFIIAPATANCIGKIAGGIADDLLTTSVMAACSPVLLVPAMNVRMYENPVTQGNLNKLVSLGYHFVPPAEGDLVCGDTGRGRMADVQDIYTAAAALLSAGTRWQGKNFLITAGPTREALDPVRYLTNHSSGKMGYALARAAVEQGADVTLISGPVNLSHPPGVRVISVTTASEMYQAVLAAYPKADVVIKAAAVTDYRPASISGQKIKKTTDDMTISLVKNPDILAELGKRKEKQILVGFAAETTDVFENAADKLSRKNLDMIVANDLTEPGAGFTSDTNIVRLIFKTGQDKQLPLMSKQDVAQRILDEIWLIYSAKQKE